MNEAYKKIYKILIILTVISMVLIALASFDIIDLSSEEGEIVYSFAISFLGICFLFSRNANVIANRKNILGNAVTVILLLYLVIDVLQLIFNFELPDFAELIRSYSQVLMIVLVLIFEVPQANSAHGNFQKLVAFLACITFCIGIGITLQSATLSTSSSSYSAYYTLNAMQTNAKVFMALLYITATGFIVNPMLRVYYIDRDYASINEVDNILYSSASKNIYYNNPNPAKMVDPKYLNPTVSAQVQQTSNNTQNYQSVPVQPKPQPPIPAPAVEPVVELPHEKVVNPNFKQENLPEAIIPTITAAPEPEVTTEQQTTNNQ